DATGTSPFISGTDTNLAEMDSTTTIGIDGFNFSDGATVQLVSASAPDITATNVVLDSDRRLLATFDLTGAAVGVRSLVVTDVAARTARLDDALRIVTPNRVRLTTSMGDIVLEMVDDAPITTSNFLQYVVDDFYDGTIFHRIVADFVVQGGGFLPDMVQPDGLRDPIMNEFSPARSNLRGTVAMAKLGNDPDSATSQFFVNLADNSSNLDNQNGGFTVFARVVEGMEVVDAIAAVPVANDVPVDDVILIRAERE
ncbi:MAG: peptidylprolyl isomerase, partial [Phycisphaerae bacterium]